MSDPYAAVVIYQHYETGRLHPCYFTWAPLPGPGPERAIRLRSRAHHTAGFDDLEAAKANAHELARECGIVGHRVVGEPISWDGEVGDHLLLPADGSLESLRA